VQARSIERARREGRSECDRQTVEGNVNWFWMNIPLEIAFLATWIGIPMWLVFRHPDRGPGAATPTLKLELEVLVSSAEDVATAAQPLAAVAGTGELVGESLETVALVG
jgi:hypothetical protein